MKDTMSALVRQKQSQRGLAIVEFAVTMPLVLFLLFATAEIGRALYQYSALTKAVRDGARYIADRAADASGVVVVTATDQDDTRKLTVYGNTAGTGAAVLPGFVTNNVTVVREGTTDYVRVTATYTFRPLFVTIPSFGVGSGIANFGTLTATAVQRNLR